MEFCENAEVEEVLEEVGPPSEVVAEMRKKVKYENHLLTSEATGASCYLTKGKVGSKYFYKIKFTKIENDILLYFLF